MGQSEVHMCGVRKEPLPSSFKMITCAQLPVSQTVVKSPILTDSLLTDC